MTKKQIVEALIDLNKTLDSIKLNNLIATIAQDEVNAEAAGTKPEEEEEEVCEPCQMLEELQHALVALKNGDKTKIHALRIKQEAQMDPELLKQLKKKVAKLFKTK
jgi:hypothetical protein